MNHATSTTFATASGRNTFQPSFMRMSYFSRGIVHRTHTKMNSRKLTLITNAITETANPNSVGGSSYQGTSHPPRNSVVISAEIVAIEMYSDMKNSATFTDESSV